MSPVGVAKRVAGGQLPKRVAGGGRWRERRLRLWRVTTDRSRRRGVMNGSNDKTICLQKYMSWSSNDKNHRHETYFSRSLLPNLVHLPPIDGVDHQQSPAIPVGNRVSCFFSLPFTLFFLHQAPVLLEGDLIFFYDECKSLDASKLLDFCRSLYILEKKLMFYLLY